MTVVDFSANESAAKSVLLKVCCPLPLLLIHRAQTGRKMLVMSPHSLARKSLMPLQMLQGASVWEGLAVRLLVANDGREGCVRLGGENVSNEPAIGHLGSPCCYHSPERGTLTRHHVKGGLLMLTGAVGALSPTQFFVGYVHPPRLRLILSILPLSP